LIPYEAYWRIDNLRVPVTVLGAPIKGQVEVVRPRTAGSFLTRMRTIDIPVEDLVGLDSDSTAVVTL
jgi:hypothetical protein